MTAVKYLLEYKEMRFRGGPRGTFKLEHWQVIALLLAAYDLIMVNFSYFLALWLRFDFAYQDIPKQYLNAWLKMLPLHGILCLAIFSFFKLYNSIWRFASYSEVVRMCEATVLTGGLHAFLITVFYTRMPISYYLLGAFFQLVFTLGIRLSYRLLLLLQSRDEHKNKQIAANRVMVIGAGAAGQMIQRDINRNANLNEVVVCFIDDNPNKWNRYIEHVPVVGGRADILKNVEKFKVNKIFLAIPSATAHERSAIINICKETNCEIKSLPGYAQMIKGEVTVSDMREVSVEDLLGREPIDADLSDVFKFINGKRVLVTGGGGSIGSELCRQIAAHAPAQLIIFDIYENSAYDIQLELLDKYPRLNLKVLIGSVRDSRKLDQLFATYKPDIVYHAAAHKHVPLMEDSPCEAIKNNDIGTYKTAVAAIRHGCQRFVLISTDKAVNPANIMGASKRICEMVIQCFDAKIKAGQACEIPELFTHDPAENVERADTSVEKPTSKPEFHTEFVAVRFGNVLGSNGSVIPIFKRQIAQGGPVTVTHPDIIRYFMTIPEAVSLVLLAGTYAQGGEIFVLDMGTPVKIDDMARSLIKLSGFQPDIDIPIVYTGLRPGEKLYEERLMAEEGLRKTDNDMISIAKPLAFDYELFLDQMQKLMLASYANDTEAVQHIVKELVPTYREKDYV